MPGIIAGMPAVGGAGEGVQVKGRAGVRGAAPVESRNDALARRSEGGGGTRLSRSDLKMFHEQILSRTFFFHFAT